MVNCLGSGGEGPNLAVNMVVWTAQMGFLLEAEAWVPEWATVELHERTLDELSVLEAMLWAQQLRQACDVACEPEGPRPRKK